MYLMQLSLKSKRPMLHTAGVAVTVTGVTGTIKSVKERGKEEIGHREVLPTKNDN